MRWRVSKSRKQTDAFPALTRLASGIKTQHQQAHLLAAEDLGHHLGY